MKKAWLTATAVAVAAASFLSASSAEQNPAAGLTDTTYSDWMLPHIGKTFYLSPDWTVATEKARTIAAPAGARLFKLVGVARDFAWFEEEEDRVGIPLAALRAVLRK